MYNGSLRQYTGVRPRMYTGPYPHTRVHTPVHTPVLTAVDAHQLSCMRLSVHVHRAAMAMCTSWAQSGVLYLIYGVIFKTEVLKIA